MAEQCSVVTVTYKSVALAPTCKWRAALPTENASTLAPLRASMQAQPSASLANSLYPLYSALFPPPHHLQSLPATSFSFPSQLRSQVLTEAMNAYFQRTWYLSFGHTTQYNSFSCWQKIMPGSCSGYRYVNYAGFVNPVRSTLSEVIPTINFLPQKSQEWAVNSSVHLVSKISFTIKWQSYIK